MKASDGWRLCVPPKRRSTTRRHIPEDCTLNNPYESAIMLPRSGLNVVQKVSESGPNVAHTVLACCPVDHGSSIRAP